MLRAYSIVRGGTNQSSLEIFGITENALKIMFGNLSLAELSKMLLNNGELVFEKDIFEIISKKKELFEMHLKNLLSEDVNRCKSFVLNSIVQCKMINNVKV